ncbi:hypothetical protein NBRC10512_006614 [Rhodotorula toruloides]|uniref:RHTO0S10e04720g1_1 n=2 Tax=Rhodotorula toruloides TaxID=5286 RepID=A0A061B6R4_RHOTO|nr:uncharacterized protein RHTO_08146 [Rhodotorula toruloides NP11]EMS22793.1 hypothetical protein RHTO_08146 [Rhodotorula toruloides NP11]KAJ8293098.1 hypothetical protein OF846_003802 [Rhodotorula toruloides]CDR45066.1 RHTO0S10e04720g1_1 [Rhodotorula toruloides]
MAVRALLGHHWRHLRTTTTLDSARHSILSPFSSSSFSPGRLVLTHAVPSGLVKENYAPSNEDVLSADNRSLRAEKETQDFRIAKLEDQVGRLLRREKAREVEEERSRQVEAYKRGMEGLVLSALKDTRKLDDADLEILRGNWRQLENAAGWQAIPKALTTPKLAERFYDVLEPPLVEKVKLAVTSARKLPAWSAARAIERSDRVSDMRQARSEAAHLAPSKDLVLQALQEFSSKAVAERAVSMINPEAFSVPWPPL